MRPDPADRSRQTDDSLPGIEGEDAFSSSDGFEPASDPISDTDFVPGRLAFEWDVQQRLWLKAILPVLQLRSHEADVSDRVRFAFDRMCISACERIGRILRADLDHESETGT